VEAIAKIPIESGEHFLAINEDSNTIFVSNNKSDSIFTIDGTTNKIVSKIQIERPRQLALNPSSNTLFAISENAGFWLRDTGAKISIVDTVSNEIVDKIGKKEGFSDIAINNETNTVYATQPKSRKIWIIDGHTRKFVDKIKVNDNYYVLTVEPKDNRIFIGGNTRGIIEKPIFSQIDCTNNKLTEIARKATFVKHRPKKLYHSNQYGLLYCLMDKSASNDADSNKTYIRQIDLNSNSMKIDSEKKSELDRMGFNPIKNHIYFSDVVKGEFSVLDHTLKEIGLFKYTEEKKRKFGKIKICVNPKTSIIYMSEEGSNLLYVIKD